EHVGITEIEPVGNYAVRLVFDDGHNTGIFSWNYLYELGAKQEQKWREYLERLEAAGYKRRS
ncbi:MAG TPA: gamma-butyrobetaine hydroxylase-like domain-containing protein, partial [Gammaproteobacteria bacterium]|nr:gamma-butyrobetaine hydroxylase-like domain-containing protein [Gammaproteobacteria bacterium]